jgi:acetylornithine deacetylase/succinyl-diaminopimelate desuccinylase-like protein
MQINYCRRSSKMSFSDLERKVLNHIDEEELVQMAVDMGNIDSPAGCEGSMTAYVHEWLRKNGLPGRRQEVIPGRENVVAVLKGSGGGKSLLFNAHMDSEAGGISAEWKYADPDLVCLRKAWVEGDKIFGKAVLNDRGPLAAFLIAAKAISKSGLQISGDVILTAVVGEIGQAPVDEYQGPQYIGKGLGTKHLVLHGVVADYALVAETTDFGIAWTEAGVVYIKISLAGEAVYTPRLSRPEAIEAHPNAIVKMVRYIDAFEEWARRYEKENIYEFDGGVVVPRAAIGAIRGGVPFMPCLTAGRCAAYIDVRLPPGKDPLSVKRELEALAISLNLEADVDIFLYRAGYVGKNVNEFRQCIEDAYQKIRARPTNPVPAPVTSMWRDINVFNEVGIPSITFGPPRSDSPDVPSSKGKFMYKYDLVDAAKVYALIAMDLCGTEQK